MWLAYRGSSKLLLSLDKEFLCYFLSQRYNVSKQKPSGWYFKNYYFQFKQSHCTIFLSLCYTSSAIITRAGQENIFFFWNFLTQTNYSSVFIKIFLQHFSSLITKLIYFSFWLLKNVSFAHKNFHLIEKLFYIRKSLDRIFFPALNIFSHWQ